MRGVADYVPAAIATAANFTDAYYARLGATIAPGGFLTLCVPLVSILGSMSMRAWPISQAKENIRIVIKLADVLNYGKWSATPVGTCAIDNFKMWISYIRIDPNVELKMVLDLGGVISIPCVDFVQTSTSVAAGSNYSATAIFVAIRKTANLGALGVFNLNRFTGGDTVGNVSYRFRIGSTIIPSSYVNAGAESRMELMRALGMQLSESTARTLFPNDGGYGGWATNVLITRVRYELIEVLNREKVDCAQRWPLHLDPRRRLRLQMCDLINLGYSGHLSSPILNNKGLRVFTTHPLQQALVHADLSQV
ncbi:hypothetical protein T492DRAFT_831476 [Pavlovales sp. CCMP2436]|nr:hypothetical protein T492DRAFT_831476 [Pavlovales sp. CCMP2436]